MKTEVAVLLTCYNRKDKTIGCLDSLFKQKNCRELGLKVYLVDDGSTDGTPEAVKANYPEVVVLNGNGELYWGGGMRWAFAEAMKIGYGYYLWLNDDVLLYDDAISKLLDTLSLVSDSSKDKVIIVGALQDSNTGALTYGGKKRRSKLLPLSFISVEPKTEPVICDTFNGNCVLIPDNVARIVGNIDSNFRQGGGDWEYGLRAGFKGCVIYLAPGYVGTCGLNSISGTWIDKNLTLKEKINLVSSLTKGNPLKKSKIFAKRYGGPFWFVYWLLSYRRLIWRNSTAKYKEDA